MHRRTLSAAARWGFTLLSVGIGVVWPLSYWWGADCTDFGKGWLLNVDVEQASLTFQWGTAVVSRSGASFFSDRVHVFRSSSPEATQRFLLPRWELTQFYRLVSVPLYIPLALTLTPAAFLWRSHLKRRRGAARGACTSCGYDRSGLPPDANCPECGTCPAD